ncbi:MAG: ECF transporter S component [Lachnospiraceae bacterium]|nr:ECF transporter S component [Lachnospiraceae bacterium]
MKRDIKKIAIVAFFSALGAILMYFDFPLPVAPTFMKMDLAEIPVIVSGFILGPVECVLVAVLKVVIKFVIKGSSTMFLGELANIIGSISYALPASLIYKALKTKERAVIGMVLGAFLSSIVCTLCNALFLFPVYIRAFYMTEEKIIEMCSKILPFIDSMNKVYLFSVLPFNLVKFSVTSVITYFFYKSISKYIKNILN